MLTVAEEKYLKAVYKILEKSGESSASTKSIALELGTSSASVTDMLQKLSDKSLLIYEKYYGATLSKDGQKIALDLIRKHRLWEVFLHKQLKFGWDQIHPLAEQLEHVQSEELIQRLDEFLGYPKFDPHGDPIPNQNGSFTLRVQKVLSLLHEINTQLLILGVKSQEKSFLQFLEQNEILPGKILKIVQYNSFDQTITLENESKKLVSLSNKICNEILVKQI
ncbi:MAG: metal-dependent transcriptional regulator [Saprospiraceae bacterium]